MKSLKCYNYDIVFQEIPDNTTLALNISGCPNHCEGCHSPWLWKDAGLELTYHFIKLLIDKYIDDITCICFMGGDQAPEVIDEFAHNIKSDFPNLKTAWYSGNDELSLKISLSNFDFIKIGRYIASKGGLRSPNTNQKFYKVLENSDLEQITFTLKNIF